MCSPYSMYYNLVTHRLTHRLTCDVVRSVGRLGASWVEPIGGDPTASITCCFAEE